MNMYIYLYTYIVSYGGRVASRWGNILIIGESGRRVYDFFDGILVSFL